MYRKYYDMYMLVQLYCRQLSGMSVPLLVPTMFLHDDVAVTLLLLCLKFISTNLIPLHGLLGLQSNVTASVVAEVPRMFL